MFGNLGVKLSKKCLNLRQTGKFLPQTTDYIMWLYGNSLFIFYLYLTEKNVVDMDLEPNDEYYNDLLKFWRKHKIYMGKEMMSTIAEAKGKITFISFNQR